MPVSLGGDHDAMTADIDGVVDHGRASASPIGRVMPMVGLDDPVQVLRQEQREFLVVVHVDHGSVAERPIQPHADRAAHVLAAAWPHLVLAFVIFVLVAHEDAHVHLVVSFVDDDMADTLRLTEVERDSKLELGHAALANPERTECGALTSASSSPPKTERSSSCATR
jgi:putative ribosome biogenesis GTPase RsgA